MYTKWSMARYLLRNRTMRCAVWTLCVTVGLSGCALLPEENPVETLPTITPIKLSQKPVVDVIRETVESKVEGTGKLIPVKQEGLYFATGKKEDNGSNRISKINYKVGDVVPAGAVIMEIDVTEKEQLLRTEQLAFRKEELAMIARLRDDDTSSIEEMEQYKIDFELKREKIVLLQQAIEKAQLKSPFSGTIMTVDVKVGDVVQDYKRIATIADLTQLVAGVDYFSAEALSQIAVGMKATIDLNTFGEFEGEIIKLPVVKNTDENMSDVQTETSELDAKTLIRIKKLPPTIQQELALRVIVVTDRRENVVVIPPSTIRTFNGRSYVQVVENNGTKREVDVELGLQTATQVEIVKGLQPGQKVVGK
jgi:macrolide-specific efflux system membrane fusion protein